MEALFGSLPEMLDFQRVFLQTLEERIASCPNFSHLETPGQFKVKTHRFLLLVCLFLAVSVDLIGLVSLFALRNSSSRWEDLFFTTPTTSSTTAASVRTTSKSRKSWREVTFDLPPNLHLNSVFHHLHDV